MRVERKRDHVLTLTATDQELSAVVAAARMALEAMRARPQAAPPEALDLQGRALDDYDRACERLGRSGSGPG